MKTKVFYTSNAGIYFCSEKSEILVDGIHDAASVGFSPMSEEMIACEKSKGGLFAGRGALLFTHLHEDHYDEDAVSEYIRKHPGTALWGPGLETAGFDDAECKGDEVRLSYGDFRIIAYNTKHSGGVALDVPHYSLLIINESSEECFFIAGDATLEEDLAHRIHRESTGASEGMFAFVMAYQMAERKSVEFVEALHAARIFLIHQPEADDGAFSRVSRIKSFAVNKTRSGVTIEEPESMSWIE